MRRAAATVLLALSLSGCAARSYSSTDRKNDQGPQWWPRYIEGVGQCECWEDRSGVEHCRLVQ